MSEATLLADNAQTPAPVVEEVSTALDALSDDAPLIPSTGEDSPRAEEEVAKAPEPTPAPEATPTPIEAVLEKVARINRGEEDVNLSAREIVALERHNQSIRDQQANWARAEADRNALVNELAGKYDAAKPQLKEVVSSLVKALTGYETLELNDLQAKGIDASIDPIIDGIKAEAERIVLEPVIEWRRARLLTTLGGDNVPLQTRQQLARLNLDQLDDAIFEAGRQTGLRAGQQSGVPTGKVLIDKSEYDALTTARDTEEKASQGDKAPPQLGARPAAAPSVGFIEHVASGGRVKTSELTLDRVLAEIPDEPLIPSRR